MSSDTLYARSCHPQERRGMVEVTDSCTRLNTKRLMPRSFIFPWSHWISVGCLLDLAAFPFSVHTLHKPSYSLVHVLSQFSTLTLSMADSALCYCKHANHVLVCPDVPTSSCSNDTSSIQQCCATGDTCGENGFCHFNHPSDFTLSGYYIGGCTDPNYKDPKCVLECSK